MNAKHQTHGVQTNIREKKKKKKRKKNCSTEKDERTEEIETPDEKKNKKKKNLIKNFKKIIEKSEISKKKENMQIHTEMSVDVSENREQQSVGSDTMKNVRDLRCRFILPLICKLGGRREPPGRRMRKKMILLKMSEITLHRKGKEYIYILLKKMMCPS